MFKHFGFSKNSQIFNRFGERIDQGFFILLAALGTIFLTVGGAYAGSFNLDQSLSETTGFWHCLTIYIFNPITGLIAGASLFLFGAYGTYKDQSAQNATMESLKSDNSELGDTRKALNTTQEQLQESKSELSKLHTDLVETWLLGVCKHLDLNSKERITIYYEHDEEFYLLARHSRNPHFSKVHRQKFPLNQGVIGQAWQHDVCIEVECPSSENLDAYKTFMNQKYGYDLSKLESLTMKSCRYVAKAVSDAGVHIGVIVFESESDDFVSQEDDEKIKEILAYCEEHQSQIAKFVRDGFKYSKEINLNSENQVQSVEDDFLELLNGGSDE
ncbi:hypothetical protein [Vibrio diabolicus]|uniref:hypothetical protein n=1 Tax=Vibrio diabolicus TaxID=50719 RepID=UPI003751ECBA|nr:hypothetical protein [Vibrio parahaemolyticus]HBN6313579.1 hypothetical protein [Vibrio parahaemolyticus]